MPKKVSIESEIEPEDYPKISEAIHDELSSRKRRRNHTEKVWDEIDRQLRMEPENSHKLNARGQVDAGRKWMPEVELPLQTQTLEMLSADYRRLSFPRNRNWFMARAALTPEYIERFERAKSPFLGEKGRGGAAMRKDSGDRIAEAMVAHWHSQYDFRAHIDAIASQAFSYSVGVGRLRKVMRKIMGHDARLGPGDEKIPVLLPMDIRKTYLDDNQYSVMHEGFTLGPNIIRIKEMQLADLKAAADGDSTYIPDQIKTLNPRKDGSVSLAEMEGDIVFERGNETVIAENLVITVAEGEKSNATIRVEEGEGFSTYIVSHYQKEGPSDAYGTSPLVKGMPIAKAAAQALNRVIESGLLKNTPPLGWDKDSPELAGRNGPVIEPGAKWPTTDEIKAYTELGGDPQTLFAIFEGLVNLYYDVTGVNAPRLGAQTKSHTTAFAKDVELTQGSVRTVDYVNSSLEGPMTKLLQLEYRMGMDLIGNKQQTIYLEEIKEFIQVTRAHLPDVVRFEAIGAGAPAEEEAETRTRLEGANTAMQIDNIAVNLGKESKLDHGKLIEEALRAAGWRNIESITVDEAAQPQQGAAGVEPTQ